MVVNNDVVVTYLDAQRALMCCTKLKPFAHRHYCGNLWHLARGCDSDFECIQCLFDEYIIMVHSCAAFNCTNRFKKDSSITFHRTFHRRLLLEIAFKKTLKDDAVPSLFNFPKHLMKVEKPPRRILNRSTEFSEPDNVTAIAKCSHAPDNISSEHNYTLSPKKRLRLIEDELQKKNERIRSLKKENLACKRKCDRNAIIISNLKSLTKELKEKT
ncbi:hypothetical protein ANN_24759 [Periplaneta americana]|uniref:C2H2-type domain-containing protein n=1 Tax=Periplaneta americana TaxID=6978 RepID=A0ABQ8RZM5_PERAM|nr:hypothetical protein ANN_24759 [Periplaneta americana]